MPGAAPGGADADDPDAGGGGRRGGGPPPRVAKDAGLNRFVWDARHSAGLTATPGAYQARLTVGAITQTQPFNLLIDPRVAADGVTTVDLKEQFDHNMRMRELVTSVNDTIARTREAQAKLKGDIEASKRIETLLSKLLTEPVRYGKPGLQAHVTYLAGMTTAADQKIGRDAVERYNVLKKELEAIRAELDRVAGSSPQRQ